MRRRIASINDASITESERKYHWPLDPARQTTRHSVIWGSSRMAPAADDEENTQSDLTHL